MKKEKGNVGIDFLPSILCFEKKKKKKEKNLKNQSFPLTVSRTR